MSRYLYPASDSDNTTLLAIKIARHTPCDACKDCAGLHASMIDEVIPDTEDLRLQSNAFFGMDDGDDGDPDYLTQCMCSHSAAEHGANEDKLGRTEFLRRAEVAIQIDDMLANIGKLTDFDYTDVDIASMRKQMTAPPPSAANFPANLAFDLSMDIGNSDSTASGINSQNTLTQPLLPPPNISNGAPKQTLKRQRSPSSSSLSNMDSDDDEPLAARLAIDTSPTSTSIVPPKPAPPSTPTRGVAGKRSSKKKTGMKVKPLVAPIQTSAPTTDAQLAEMNDATRGGGLSADPAATPVKLEDVVDKTQLDALASGVPVESGGHVNKFSSVKTVKEAVNELAKGIIQIRPVQNDGYPKSTIIMTGLKNLFQKQLPMMPKEYIARLVYDTTSRGLAIVKRGLKVVGGICFRPFAHRGFAEIVFFATASSEQDKGYGAMLMDHFKTHIKEAYPGMMHFLTYADNDAIGYFRKQGFSKEISLDRSVWAGYIKDYEGGTIMLCTMLRKVNYLEKKDIVQAQKDAIVAKIREKSKSHVVYKGLDVFRNAIGEVSVDPSQVPGLRETGWTLAMAASHQNGPPRSAEQALMQRILGDLRSRPQSWCFQKPVDAAAVPDYYDVIKNAMDFQTMDQKLQTGMYKDRRAFLDDAQLVFDNSRLYNSSDSIYFKSANKLEKYLKERMAEKARLGE